MPTPFYLYLAPVIPISFMVISDFRKRMVNTLWLAVSGILMLTIALVRSAPGDVFLAWTVNTAVACLLFGGGAIYWRTRHRKWVNPVNNMVGLGDLVFMFSFGFLFDLRQFIIVLLVSMIGALVWWAAVKLCTGKGRSIPLVSSMGTVMIIWFLIQAAGL